MSLIAKDSGDFVTVPPGMHLGRCYRIIDLGTQRSEYLGVEKFQPKVMIQFEVHGEDDQGKPLQTKDGRPLSISKSYTVTLVDKSNLRKDLQMWRGRDFTSEELRGFELKNVLGAWAMLSITHTESNGKTYTNIAGVNPVPANMKKAGLPEGVNELQVFTLDDPDMKMFDSFSENLKKRISSSPEWSGVQDQPKSKEPEFNTTGLDDDIPFN